MHTLLCVLPVLVAFLPSLAAATQPSHFWSQSFGADLSDRVLGVAVDPSSGDIIVAGHFANTMSVAGLNLAAVGGAADAWVARLDRRGHVKWAKGYGSLQWDEITGVALDAAGNIYLVGTTNGFVNFGGSDVFGLVVVKVDANGGHLWSHGFTGTDWETPQSIAVDALGNVFIAGDSPAPLASAARVWSAWAMPTPLL